MLVSITTNAYGVAARMLEMLDCSQIYCSPTIQPSAMVSRGGDRDRSPHPAGDHDQFPQQALSDYKSSAFGAPAFKLKTLAAEKSKEAAFHTQGRCGKGPMPHSHERHRGSR